MFEFETALEARKVYSELGDRMHKTACLRWKKDIWAIYENISSMISVLSSLEVDARRTRNPRRLPEQRQKIQDAMILLDKLVMIEILMH